MTVTISLNSSQQLAKAKLKVRWGGRLSARCPAMTWQVQDLGPGRLLMHSLCSGPLFLFYQSTRLNFGFLYPFWVYASPHPTQLAWYLLQIKTNPPRPPLSYSTYVTLTYQIHLVVLVASQQEIINSNRANLIRHWTTKWNLPS
jgi:hypothetical protein